MQRHYAQSQAAVIAVFDRATKCLTRKYRGVDHLGQPLDDEDLVPAATLGVLETVDRYDPERAGGRCVSYVLARVRYSLQLASGSTRKRQRVVGLEEVGEAS